MKLSEHDRMRLAVETKLSLGVIHRFVNGGNVTAANIQTIEKAAEKLEISLKGKKAGG